MRQISTMLIIGIISTSAFGQAATQPTPDQPTSESDQPVPAATETSVPAPQGTSTMPTAPDAQTPEQTATPADIIKQHTDAITAKIKNLPPCDPAQYPNGCHLDPALSFMDFAIYFQFCPQLNNWDVSYTVTTNIILTLTQAPSGDCQVSVNYGSLNFPSKSCILSPQQSAMISSMQTLIALHQHDIGQYQGGDIGNYIKPIVDCFETGSPNFSTDSEPQHHVP